MTSNRNLAKKLSRQRWSEVHSFKKLDKGIWYSSNAAHGGYVVDTDEVEGVPHKVLEEFKSTVFIRKNSNKYRRDNQHFATFEEDNAWAVLEHHRPDLMEKQFEKFDWNVDSASDYDNKEEFIEWRKELIEMQLNRYFEDYK